MSEHLTDHVDANQHNMFAIFGAPAATSFLYFPEYVLATAKAGVWSKHWGMTESKHFFEVFVVASIEAT